MSHQAASVARDGHKRVVTHVLLRDNGMTTPLIPYDELPDNVVVVGVPRVLPIADALAAGLTPAGHEPVRIGTLKVDLPSASSVSLAAEPETIKSSEELERENRDRRRILLLGEEKLFPPPTGFPVIRFPPPGAYDDRPEPIRPLLPSPPAPAEREYPPVLLPTELCLRWIDTAECNQEGCPGIHAMPETREGIARAGRQDWPAWFKMGPNRRHWRKIRDRLPPLPNLAGANNRQELTATVPQEGVSWWDSSVQDETRPAPRVFPLVMEHDRGRQQPSGSPLPQPFVANDPARRIEGWDFYKFYLPSLSDDDEEDWRQPDDISDKSVPSRRGNYRVTRDVSLI
ncbi:MAG: hypothetical protein M4579_002729 [Chaenotheca gracillima]|nr:MAG: hypothetical protein M4579_002729 [Chaenotheca gracillima]